MIDIRIKTVNRRVHTSYDIKGYNTLGDVALVLLELEKIRERLLKESDNYEPDLQITKKGD